MPTSSFDTLTTTGGPIEFTTSTSTSSFTFDTLTTAAQTGTFTASASTGGGPAVFAAPTLTVEAWDAANTSLLGTLDETFDRGFQDEFSGLGSGSVSMLASDADVALAAKTLRFKLDDTYAFSSRVEARRWRTVTAGEERDQVVTLSGRGLASEWDDAVVYPYGGVSARPISDQRAFAWWSPELSTSGWSNSTTIVSGVVAQVRETPPLPDPWTAPLGWPADIAAGSVDWIFSRYSPTGSNLVGSSLFRTTFTTSAERVSIFYTASSRCRLYIDGIAVGDWTTQPSEESWLHAYRATPYLSAGTHHIAFEVDTQRWTAPLPDLTRGLLICAVYSGGVGATYNSGSRLLGSTASWKCLDYPAVFPAPTPGKVLSTLLAEAQARGALTGWTLGCTDTVDSAGQPWGNDTAHVFRVGDTYAQVLQAMADVSIEFRARPVSKVLDVWRKGTVTEASGQSFTAGVNLLELEENQPL